MKKYTVNENGFINDIDDVVDGLVETYKGYIREIFTNKTVADLSLNEMAFIRLVSSSSILAMRKKGETMLDILNKPINKPSVAKSQPVTEDAVAAFLAKLSPEKRKQLLGIQYGHSVPVRKTGALL